MVHLQSATGNSGGYSQLRAMGSDQIPYFTDKEVEILKDKASNQIIHEPSYHVRETEILSFKDFYHFPTLYIKSNQIISS